MSDTNNTDFLKTIDSYFTFLIPAYQRGYRWQDRQVRELLDDLNDFFSKPNNNGYYLLQPVIVKKIDNNKYELVDGQQRLTTIYLIAKYLGLGEPYKINYTTRSKSLEFLQNIKDKTEDDAKENSDFYRMYYAWQTIDGWFSSKKVDDKNKCNRDLTEEKKKKKVERFRNNLLDKVKVIWYETNEDGKKVFLRVNVGKIPLTDAELIRAFFLKAIKDYYYSIYNNKAERNVEVKDNKEKGTITIEIKAKEFLDLRLYRDEQIKNEQINFAQQWDEIMSWIRNDEFWAFLFDPNIPVHKRADEFFKYYITTKNKKEILYEFDEDEYKNNPSSYIFSVFYEKHKTQKWQELEKAWKDIKQFFNKLLNWYLDKETYHLVGFYLWKVKKDMNEILAKQTVKAIKYDIKKELFEQLIKVLKFENGIKIEYRNFYASYKQEKHKNKSFKWEQVETAELKNFYHAISSLSYGDNDDALKFIFFLHNLAIYHNDPNDIRFPFKEFKDKKVRWSIEHIFARSHEEIKEDDKNIDDTILDELLKEVEEYLIQTHLKKIKDLKKDEPLSKKIREYIKEPKEELLKELKEKIQKDDLLKEFETYLEKAINGECQNKTDEKERQKCQKLNRLKFLLEHIENKDNIRNLCLLPASLNSKLNNKTFNKKRKIVIEQFHKPEKESYFVPLATFMAFNKLYTLNSETLKFWFIEELDGENYLNHIVNSIVEFLKPEKQ